MIMACTASKIIEIALAEVGYLEKKTNAQLDSKTANAGYNNWNKYARDLDTIPNFYNGKKNGYYWCDVFVDWLFYKAFGADKARALLCQPEKSYGAGCTYSARYFKNKGQLFSTPKPGDQIFFGNKKTHECTHTGIVYKVDASYVYTVEGNTSGGSGIIANGGGVAKKRYTLNNSGIYGYGRPKYDQEDLKPATPETAKPGNVVYCAYASGKWWSDITNFNNTNSMGYAGVTGKPMQGLRVEASDRDIFYRVHTVGGGWLGTIKNRDGSGANSYAGIYGKNIDGVQIKTNKGKVKYRVHVSGGNWLSWITCGGEFGEPSGNGYAGIYGKAIDRIQICLE